MCGPKLTQLTEEVERIFGRKILNASDCLMLGREILDQTHLNVSINTLRRTFNLMKSKYNPSLFTLDILSKYCGYTSYSDFTGRSEKTDDQISNQDTGLLDFLTLLFRDTDIQCINDTTYINLIHVTINNLEQWPTIIDRFQCRIAKTINGQIFYFEQFINIDKLNSYFGEGLRYYLHEKRKPEAQMRGHSLLCLNGWLTANHRATQRHYLEVIRYNLDETTDMFVCGRYFATQLFYADTMDKEFDPILHRAREFYMTLNTSRMAAKSFPAFEYILSETLVLLRQYSEAIFYINELIKKRNNYIPTNISSRLFESVYLFQATALFNIGKIEKARDVFDTINTTNFNFLAKQYNSILYLLLKKQIDKRKNQDKQLCYLVQQTGFKTLFNAAAVADKADLTI